MERIHGPVGRLGRYAATHSRLVIAIWVVIAVGLGLFAPRAETSLYAMRHGLVD